MTKLWCIVDDISALTSAILEIESLLDCCLELIIIIKTVETSTNSFLVTVLGDSLWLSLLIALVEPK